MLNKKNVSALNPNPSSTPYFIRLKGFCNLLIKGYNRDINLVLFYFFEKNNLVLLVSLN